MRVVILSVLVMWIDIIVGVALYSGWVNVHVRGGWDIRDVGIAGWLVCCAFAATLALAMCARSSGRE